MAVVGGCGQIPDRNVYDHHHQEKPNVDPASVVPDEVDTLGPVDEGPQRFVERRDVGRREYIGEHVSEAPGQGPQVRYPL